MTNDVWLQALDVELRSRGIAAEMVAHVVTEAAQHLRDSGEPATRTFGAPGAYALAIVESVAGAGARRARRPGPVRLQARGITKRYGRRMVLDGVDLAVRSGEVAAIVGANGCGKSTFLRICGGLVSPDRGEVYVDGTLGFCPQQGGTYDFLNPDEHFVLVGAGRDWSRGRSRTMGRAAAGLLDWDATAPALSRDLSGGTRQKLNLVLAGLGDPDVLLLDEPYQGFDHGSYLDFWQQVWRWRDLGSAVVVVTHLLSHLDLVDTVLDLTRPTEGMPPR
jgi:ABC-type nitrate/sulfonate/bicarbonate transport system ATPase subunit